VTKTAPDRKTYPAPCKECGGKGRIRTRDCYHSHRQSYAACLRSTPRLPSAVSAYWSTLASIAEHGSRNRPSLSLRIDFHQAAKSFFGLGESLASSTKTTLIDTDDTDVSQGGIFALLDDSVSLIIKQVQLVYESGHSTGRIRCTPRNPVYSPFELTLGEDARIIGRVVQKVTRFL
jgi:hypothetical protein